MGGPGSGAKPKPEDKRLLDNLRRAADRAEGKAQRASAERAKRAIRDRLKRGK